MRQPVSHRAYHFLPILYCALALLLAAPARAQEGEPPVESMTESMAEPPANAVILSLQDVLNAALEHNLDIAVKRYDPLRSQTQVTVQESVFDPSFLGSAESSEDQFPFAFSTLTGMGTLTGVAQQVPKNHRYTAGFEDPLVTGGSYRIDFVANDDITTTQIPGNLARTASFNTSWRITFRQPLLRNLGPDVNKWQILVARDILQVSEEGFRETVQTTLADAEKAYWDLNFALMELQTQLASLNLATEFLEQNKIKVRVGTLAPIEITQAEADVANREELVIVAEHLVLQGEDNLRQIMNVPRDSPWWVRPIRPSDAPPFEIVELDVEQFVVEAGKHRPDLRQARIDLRAKQTEISARENERRWALDFEGSFGSRGFSGETFMNNTLIPNPPSGSYSDAFDDLRDSSRDNWRLALNLTVPVGNRLAIANYVNAEYALDQARFEMQRREQLALIEVRNAARTVLTNRKRVGATRVNMRLQREKMEAEQKKFENGMSTSFQVLTFQNDLTAASSRENLAIVDYNKSLVELELVKGTLLEARRMMLPGDDTPGSGAARAAAFQSLWMNPRSGGGPIADGTAGDDPATTLPTSFVYRGDGIVGIGATIEIKEESTAGR